MREAFDMLDSTKLATGKAVGGGGSGVAGGIGGRDRSLLNHAQFKIRPTVLIKFHSSQHLHSVKLQDQRLHEDATFHGPQG